MDLKSAVVAAESLDDAIEMIYERGWTDGLPVVVPTQERVKRVMDFLNRDPNEVIGVIPPREGQATVEKIAINSVMAGCKPEYVPVVIAAVQCMLEEKFNLHGVQASTHPVAPLTIVSGPITGQLGFNAGDGCFGGGSRANATVGRAVRLILWNIGGGYAGDVDKATHGHPGKYSYCIAENLEHSPWESLHSSRGVYVENAVTVFGCEGPHNVWTGPGDAHTALSCIAEAIKGIGNTNVHTSGQCLVVIGPRAASVLSSEGISRKDVQDYLYEYAYRSVGDLRRGPKAGEDSMDPARLGLAGSEYTLWPRWVDVNNEDARMPIFGSPDDILVMAAGGWGSKAGFCMVCPGWGYQGGIAQTRPLVLPS